MKPALTLLLLGPWVAEYLLGSHTVLDLPVIFFLVPMYGGGVLLIRELARRTRRGWPTMLLLGLAYGLIEAGLLDMSLFNPTYMDEDFNSVTHIPWLGVSATYSVAFIVGHTVWSIGTPIALVEAWWPSRASRPWLGRFGLGVAAALYLSGSALIRLEHRATEQFTAATHQQVLAGLGALVLVAAAFLVGRPRSADAPLELSDRRGDMAGSRSIDLRARRAVSATARAVEPAAHRSGSDEGCTTEPPDGSRTVDPRTRRAVSVIAPALEPADHRSGSGKGCTTEPPDHGTAPDGRTASTKRPSTEPADPSRPIRAPDGRPSSTLRPAAEPADHAAPDGRPESTVHPAAVPADHAAPVERPDVARTPAAPRPRSVALAAFLVTATFICVPGNWAGVALAVVLVVAAAVVLRRWSRRPGWGPAHSAALAAGALMTQAAVGFILHPWHEVSSELELASDVLFAAVAAVMGVFAVHHARFKGGRGQVTSWSIRVTTPPGTTERWRVQRPASRVSASSSGPSATVP